MKNNLEKFNFLWKTNISQAEYNDILDKHPDLWSSYLLQEEIARAIRSRERKTYKTNKSKGDF